jgi:predicted transcriptional regulator of viral defense system
MLGNHLKSIARRNRDRLNQSAMDAWVTKQESIETSDLERTILDGLRHPEYCGGITDVAKGLWMRHDDVRAPN